MGKKRTDAAKFTKRGFEPFFEAAISALPAFYPFKSRAVFD